MSLEKIIVHVDPDLEGLIPGFLEHRNSDVEKLRSALNDKNFEKICTIAHSIKGVGGGYGFDLMTTIGADIESTANERNTDEILEKINQLDDYLQRVEIEYA